MNEQSQMMNQKHQVRSNSQFFLMNQSHKLMNYSQSMGRSQMLNIAPSQAPMVVNQPMMVPPQMMNQSNMMGPSYGQWSQPPNMPLPPAPMNAMKFANPNPMNQMYAGVAKPGPRRSSWKNGNKSVNKRKDVGWKDNGGYQPPTLNELEQQNRLRARRFFHKKKFNRMGPYAHAPRNTTSYIIRAKKSGGIASLVSPCPVTPAVLPTPVFSPSREALVDMAKEEWGVDGYGSMKGLIRLRSSPGHDEGMDEDEDEDDEGSSESDVEEHVEVERRLDHDLNRFEMIYPNSGIGVDYNNVLENRVDDQDTHIAQLEEDNLILKERLYLMESEVGDLRRRLSCLERQNQSVEDVNEEVVENVSENGSEGEKRNPYIGNNHNEEVDFVPRNDHSDEMTQINSTEVAMKEGVFCEAVDNNREDDEQVEELNVVQEEQHESGYNEEIGTSALGAIVEIVPEEH